MCSIFSHHSSPKRLPLLLSFTVLGLIARTEASASALFPTPSASEGQRSETRNSFRILVKVKPSLAQELEAQLPDHSEEIAIHKDASARTAGFAERHQPRKMTAVYGNMIRLRQRTGWSDAEMAQHIRGQFALRAQRQPHFLPAPDISRTYVLEFEGGPSDLEGMLTRLQADPDVEYAEREHKITVCATPNDPYLSSSGSWGQSYGDLWGLNTIKAPLAWATNQGSGVVVAVVDSGLDYLHPDISANLWTNTREIAGNGVDDDNNGYVDDTFGWDFAGVSVQNPVSSNDPMDRNGHGTHVAGIIAATGNNNLGIAGVAYNAKIMTVKGLDDAGGGSDSSLAQSVIYAAKNGADIINASWIGKGSSQTVAEAVQYATSLGTIVVAAAGNNWNQDVSGYFPAHLSDVITVTASDSNGALAGFSNMGAKIDVAAPGVDILSLRASNSFLGPLVGDSYMRLEGTSQAAPHVSGLAALVLAQNPTYTTEDVRQVLRASAVDAGNTGWDPQFGSGIIDASKALSTTSVLKTHIGVPQSGAHINAPLSVSGVVSGSNLRSWVLEYGIGKTPSTWVRINGGSGPVTNGALGTFDGGAMADGPVLLRLTSTDSSGRTFTDYRDFEVDYVHFTNPAPTPYQSLAVTYKPGTLVEITGGATNGNFSSYSLKWAPGINPTSGWSTTGIVLTDGGTKPVLEGPLGTWTAPATTTAGFYTLRLTAGSHVKDTLVYLEPALLSSNWPLYFDNIPANRSGVVPVGAPDGSTHLAVAFRDYGNGRPVELRTYASDGTLKSATALSSGYYFSPAAGEVDAIAGEELVQPNYALGNVTIFRSDNTQRVLSLGGSTMTSFDPIVLEDMDGDGQPEILDYPENNPGQEKLLYAWKKDGTLLNSNFPLSVPNPGTAQSANDGSSKMLVGDFNGDGKKEFLVVKGLDANYSYTFALYSNLGAPLPFNAPTIQGQPRALVAADLDRTGKLSTLFVNSDGSVHALNPDGSERSGWPIAFTIQPFSVVVGDLDGNGSEEIVLADAKSLTVLNANGTTYSNAWPRPANGAFCGESLVLADINGDGRAEILVGEKSTPNLVGSSMSLLALTKDNTLAKSWNLQGRNGFGPFENPRMTVGDFNRDGLTDIAVVYGLMLAQPGFNAIETSVMTVLTTGTTYSANANPWPMLLQNPRNTSVRSVASVPVQSYSTTLYSIAGEDGRTTSAAGINATDNTTSSLRLGDWSDNTAYRSILSFDTSTLPANANITGATLKLTRGTSSGTVTAAAFGSIKADIKTGYFGTAASLAAGDWSAAATTSGVATLNFPSTNGAASQGPLSAAGLSAIQKGSGAKTQFRVNFSNATNSNRTADYLGFYSGEHTTTPANRPTLTVTYQLPVSPSTAPKITTQPVSQTVSLGQTATFSVVASGTAPLSYQWKKNGLAMGGATASSYTTPAAVAGDNGSVFTVEVSNGAGLVTSSPATLTVQSGGNLMGNGGFENATTTPWAGNTTVIGSWPTQTAYEGTRCAFLCGKGLTTTHTLTQAVTIPASAATAKLNFYLHIDTAETGSSAYDKLVVSLQNTSGTTLKTLATYSNANAASGYSLKTFDVSAYKGQSLTVSFKGTEDSTKQTSFVLDNVSLVTQ